MVGLISENNLWKENIPETKNIMSQGFKGRVNLKKKVKQEDKETKIPGNFKNMPHASIACHGSNDNRADSRLVPSQWETLLQSNGFSDWPGANLESEACSVDVGNLDIKVMWPSNLAAIGFATFAT